MSSNMKEKLIAAVREQPSLWDGKNWEHCNRYAMAWYWKRIGNSLSLPAAEVSRTWKNLRTQFKKQLEKVMAENPGAKVETYPRKSSWQYFNSMFFLIGQFEMLTKGPNWSSTSKEKAPNNNECSTSTSWETVVIKDKDVAPFNMSKRTPSTNGKKPIKRAAVFAEDPLQIKKEKPNLNEVTLDHNRDEKDEDVAFFNSMLPSVKLLSPKRKLLFRMGAQEALYKQLEEGKIPELH